MYDSDEEIRDNPEQEKHRLSVVAARDAVKALSLYKDTSRLPEHNFYWVWQDDALLTLNTHMLKGQYLEVIRMVGAIGAFGLVTKGWYSIPSFEASQVTMLCLAARMVERACTQMGVLDGPTLEVSNAAILPVGSVLPDGRRVTGYQMLWERPHTQITLPCGSATDFYAEAALTARNPGSVAYYRLFYKLDDPVLDRQFVRGVGVAGGTVVVFHEVNIPTRYLV